MAKKLHPALTQAMSDLLCKAGVTDLASLSGLSFKEAWLKYGPSDAGKSACPRRDDFYSLFRAMGELDLKLQDLDPATQLAALMDPSFLNRHMTTLGTRTYNALARVGLYSELCYQLLSVEDIVAGTKNFGTKMSDRLTAVLRAQGIRR